jgi:hypothetical protein
MHVIICGKFVPTSLIGGSAKALKLGNDIYPVSNPEYAYFFSEDFTKSGLIYSSLRSYYIDIFKLVAEGWEGDENCC